MLTFLLILFAAYLMALLCRRDCPQWAGLEGHCYAHRGLHGAGIPENSLAAFREAVEAGYGMELDVHLLADGGLAVIHDSLLNRTTGQAGRVEDLKLGDLGHYFLEGTGESIPEFSQVLDLVRGRVPLIIELKAEGDNQAALAEAVCKALEGYQGAFCLESFDPRCLMWLRKNRPELLRGQLAENFSRTKNDLPDLHRLVLTHLLTNFLTCPDFIAYRFDHRKTTLSVDFCRKLWGVRCAAWTLRTPEAFAEAQKEGWLPIFEGFRPEGTTPDL